MTHVKLTKELSGVYKIGSGIIYRSSERSVGRYWVLTGLSFGWPPRFRTLRAAEIAARVYLGEEITDEQRDTLAAEAI